MAQNNCSTNENKHKKFVDYIFKICRKDCGIAAKLKRSGSENQAVSSWGILVQCGIDIENDNKRIPYSLVAEFIARSKLESDSGSDSFGRVLRLAISKKKSSVKDISDASSGILDYISNICLRVAYLSHTWPVWFTVFYLKSIPF